MASAFGASSTTDEVLSGMDLRGKRILVTGVSAGLGVETARAFEWKSIPQGAATSVWAGLVATADEIAGQYCENCLVGKIVPDDVTITAASEGVRGYALDPNHAEALWKKSEELVGERY
jgi:NAD(P)-dependent dehydrogenase (short-subunit alcohol dehydrogenase family)